MRTSIENIKNVTAFLNAVCDFLNKNKNFAKSEELRKIQDLYKIPYSQFKVAKDLGYFTKIAEGKYQSNFVHFEPTHARELILAQTKRQIEKRKLKAQQPLKPNSNKKNQEGKNTTKHIKVKIAPDENVIVPEKESRKQAKKEEPKQNKKQRVFSLFWGLIKFNY